MMLTYTPKLYECSCCHQSKPEIDFYRESYTNARTNQCKACINIKRRVQRDRAKHGKFVSKEKVRAMEDVSYSLVDWRDAMLHFYGSCAFCGKPEGRARKDKLDRDHLLPLSLGGRAERSNIIPACRKCNRGRGNKLWREWYELQDFYDSEKAARIESWSNQGASPHSG